MFRVPVVKEEYLVIILGYFLQFSTETYVVVSTGYSLDSNKYL